jgi:hypothetical protein
LPRSFIRRNDDGLNACSPEDRNIITDSPFVLAILMFMGVLFVSLSTTFIYFRF